MLGMRSRAGITFPTFSDNFRKVGELATKQECLRIAAFARHIKREIYIFTQKNICLNPHQKEFVFTQKKNIV